MSDLNLPGAEDEGIMGDKPAPSGARKLAEDAGGDATPSPLTLALCPSVLARSIRARQNRRGKLDRKVVSQLARKVGLTREMLEGRRER